MYYLFSYFIELAKKRKPSIYQIYPDNADDSHPTIVITSPHNNNNHQPRPVAQSLNTQETKESAPVYTPTNVSLQHKVFNSDLKLVNESLQRLQQNSDLTQGTYDSWSTSTAGDPTPQNQGKPSSAVVPKLRFSRAGQGYQSDDSTVEKYVMAPKRSVGYRSVRATSVLNPQPVYREEKKIGRKEKEEAEYVSKLTRKDTFSNFDLDPIVITFRNMSKSVQKSGNISDIVARRASKQKAPKRESKALFEALVSRGPDDVAPMKTSRDVVVYTVYIYQYILLLLFCI